MKHRITLSTLLVALVLAAVTPSSARAEKGETKSPISLSLFPPVQIVPEKGSVYGFRLNLYGVNHNVSGLDIGLVNRVENDFVGLQWLGFGWVKGNLQGAQWNYITNVTKGTMEGVQFGIVDLAGKKSAGAQLGVVTWAKTGLTGAQLGVVDYAETFTGLQFGLVNVTDNLTGLQLGLVNVAKNGFLPVFPLFNFNFE